MRAQTNEDGSIRVDLGEGERLNDHVGPMVATVPRDPENSDFAELMRRQGVGGLVIEPNRSFTPTLDMGSTIAEIIGS